MAMSIGISGPIVVVSLEIERGHDLLVNPDPAIVQLGDTVGWEVLLHAAHLGGKARITITFSRGTPFGSGQFRQVISLDERGEGNTTISAGPATAPGDYKYDVEADDEDGRIIKVDPRIIVR